MESARFAFLALMTGLVITGSPNSDNWCQVGQMVMIPDGREGPVTSVDGNICRVLAYGEKYVSLWTYEMVEPVRPAAGTAALSHGP